MYSFKNYCTETKFVEKILHFKTCVGGRSNLDLPTFLKGCHCEAYIHNHTYTTEQTLTIPLEDLCLGAQEPKVPDYEESSVSHQGLLPKLEGQAWVLRWDRQIQPIPALFVQIIRKVPISPYFDEGFCVVNICPLASGQCPSLFHKKHQTAVRWPRVWANTK